MAHNAHERAIDRNEQNRLRVLDIAVTIRLGKGGAEIGHLD